MLILSAVLVLPGCATYSAGIARVEQETSNRNLDGALKSLDELKLTGADQVLYHLNKGTLLRFQGDYAGSNQQFESAKSLMEKLGALSVAEQAGSVMVNDTLKAYEGVGNEQLLIYAFEELNYLQSGNVDEAAVEARQFDIKQRLIAAKDPAATYLSGAFVRYLNGMVYEEAGEPDSARIDYLKAVEGYNAQSSITGFGAPAALKADLERLAGPPAKTRPATAKKPAAAAMQSPDKRDTGEVVFILHDGLGPTLAENILSVVNPDPQHGTAIMSVAVPQLVQRPVPVARFELSGGSQSASSELVEDVNAIARKSLEDRLPAITARAVARLVLKNAMAKKVKKQNEDGGTGGLLLSIVTDVGAIVSERADTRSWSLLPGNFLMARLALPAGTHDLKVNYYDNSGNILAIRDYQAVKVAAGRRVFLSDYYLGASAAN
ncbi:MAG TPA: hypothetical protein VLS47_04060 [Gallionella sp.]|nr:hypothetical protein [Gallionella sp.]